jgi:AraC-like DNA-binding protein
MAFVLLDAAIRGAAVLLLLLLAGIMVRDRPNLRAAQAGMALCLGLCMQVISSTPAFEAGVPRLLQAPWVAVSVGNGVLFWAFVQALFDDEFTWRPVHGVAWLAVAGLSALNCAVVAGSASILAPWSVGVQRAVPLVFTVLSALAAARHWSADLVEARRRLRGFIVVAGIGYTLLSLSMRLGSPQGRLQGATATLDAAVLLLVTALVAMRLLQLTRSDLFPAQGDAVADPVAPATTSDAPPPFAPTESSDPDGAEPEALAATPNPADERLAQSLQRVMVEEHAYREEDLSLSRLAERLAVPEYRLRRVINQRLGHRNFNAFINGYRLDAVRIALADPARRELPVLTLALEAGFQSIGPFNRAFKAATGLTPTEFRRQHSADS